MRILSIVFLLICICFSSEIGNGNIKIIEIPSQNAKELLIDGKKGIWIENPVKEGYKFAIIAAEYNKDSDVIVRNGNNVDFSEIRFDLIHVAYPKERLNVDPSKVKPPLKAKARIQKELKEANEIYASNSKGIYFNSPFSLPLQSVITSGYGAARVFNGKLKSFHSGTDFRAQIGEKIAAANSGIVKLAKDRYFAGNSVIIDHGSGIYTQYYHLSKIFVKVGQKVEKGDIIGLSGASGRITGPHLHFGVVVNQIQVNPLNFIEKINEIFVARN